MRVKCIVSYDGSQFHGFQIQNKQRTVQGEIQKALKKINEKDVMVVSDSDKIREMDNRGEYEKIYEEEGFVSVYKCGR